MLREGTKDDKLLKRTLTMNDARLLGMVTIQTFCYFSKFLKDPLWMKALVRSPGTAQSFTATVHIIMAESLGIDPSVSSDRFHVRPQPY